MGRCARLLPVLAALVLLPADAHAQVNVAASIAGVVRDTSGAVLPGVTVEASSPALIEKLRFAVTDGTGQYLFVDLRPGTYIVTFSLPGFSTVRREGIELSGSFTATVNADLRVGSLEETITVTGETPIVDVRSTRRQQTMESEVLAAIPSGRQYFSLTALVPALNVQGNDVGGASGPIFSVFQTHGGRRNEGQVRVEGLSAGFQGMGVSFYVPDVGNAQEVTFSLSGGLGEAETVGPQMNIIPRTGGNVFSGNFFVTGANGALQGNNFDQTIIDAGLRVPNKLEKLWDANAAFGGPIARDRLWFYWTVRHQGNRNQVAGMWLNRNAGDPTKWAYEPDFDRQAVDDGTWKNTALRLTWQATLRNKFNFWWDEQAVCQHCLGGGSLVGGSPRAPEAHGRTEGPPQRMGQAVWTSPVSNRFLLEASFGLGPDLQYGGQQKNAFDQDLIPVQEQAGLIPNLNYRASNWSRPHGITRTVITSASYVTGAHSAKFGGRYQYNQILFVDFNNDHRLAYRFRNGVPNQLTMLGLHSVRRITQQGMSALYAQDQWTRERLTLQGGVRFEHIGSHFPDQQVGPDRFITVPLKFPAQDSGVSVKDIMPRLGAVYDLFGSGRTAVKVSLGRYVTPENSFGIYGNIQNPITRVTGRTNRAWTDANRDYVPDCDLLNPQANGECGPWSDRNFGQQVFTTTYDPDILNGWNAREYSWDFTATAIQQLAPRVSVDISYVRRIWGNFAVTDNRAVGPADFDRFSVVAPGDSRLPGGGGFAIADLYDVSAAKFGLVDNFVTFADKFGKQLNHYNGVDVSVNARTPFGLTVQGGLSTGRTMVDECEIVAKLPEIYIPGMGTIAATGAQQSRQFCHVETPFLTQVKGLSAYTIPKVDVQISGTFQSKPYVGANQPSIASQSLAANWVVPNGLIAPSLGRNLAGGAAVASVNLLKAGTMYGDRINQIDLRFSKFLTYHRARTRIALDLFNAFNANTIDSYQQAFGASWLNPTSILPARIAKISAQVDF